MKLKDKNTMAFLAKKYEEETGRKAYKYKNETTGFLSWLSSNKLLEAEKERPPSNGKFIGRVKSCC